MRSISDADAYAPDETLAPAQTAKLEGLLQEPELPVPFAVTLECAMPKLSLRRDLYALYGLLQGTMLRLRGIEDTRALGS